MGSSRRNFVVGIGAILSGGSTLLGSGAFDVAPDSRPTNWVSFETQTSDTLSFSLGSPISETEDDGATPPDDDQPGEDDDDDQAEPPGDDDDDQAEPPGGDEDDDGVAEPPGDGDDGDPEGDISIRLQASGPDVLDSPHVLTDEEGTLSGVVLEGLNERARTYVGETSNGRYPNPSAGDRVAFLVINDGDAPVQLGVDVTGTAPEVFGLPASTPQPVDLTEDVIERFDPGQTIYVVIEVDTMTVDTVTDDAVKRVTFVASPL